jgi:predicted RNA-binding protein with PUA-like domain
MSQTKEQRHAELKAIRRGTVVSTKAVHKGPSYWLMKSEPSEVSIDDLKKQKRLRWDGIRNYQVRNMLRDEFKIGDYALFYHSSTKEIGVVGEMKIIQAGYPDPTQFDSKSKYFDPLSKKDNPRWIAVNVEFVSKFEKIVPLSVIKADKTFKNMALIQTGNRLSISHISAEQYDRIYELSGGK